MSILIAIGGATGAGKTTLAYALRRAGPRLADALIVEGDQTRRRMRGYDIAYTMTPEDYTDAVTAQVEAQKVLDIREALWAGCDVIEASGFWSETSRSAIEGLAAACGAHFVGLWLDAPRKVLATRIEKRLAERAVGQGLSVERGHASDACLGVLEKYGVPSPPVSPRWQVLDGSLPAQEIIRAALLTIHLSLS